MSLAPPAPFPVHPHIQLVGTEATTVGCNSDQPYREHFAGPRCVGCGALEFAPNHCSRRMSARMRAPLGPQLRLTQPRTHGYDASGTKEPSVRQERRKRSLNHELRLRSARLRSLAPRVDAQPALADHRHVKPGLGGATPQEQRNADRVTLTAPRTQSRSQVRGRNSYRTSSTVVLVLAY